MSPLKLLCALWTYDLPNHIILIVIVLLANDLPQKSKPALTMGASRRSQPFLFGAFLPDDLVVVCDK